MMMYYAFWANTVYNCAFSHTGIRRNEKVHLAGLEAFADFNRLYVLGNEAETSGDADGKINILAARDENKGAVMVVMRDFEGTLELDVAGEYSKFDIKRTNDANENRAPYISHQYDIALENGKARLSVRKNEILLLSFK
jgi:hypothetical protein